MPAKIHCPKCQLEIRVPVDFAGRTVKCPQCYERFRVPGDDSPTAPSAPTAPATRKPPVAKFDRLVQNALRPDTVEAFLSDDDDPALAPRPSQGPSHFWQCPHCRSRWEKPAAPESAPGAAPAAARVHCQSCGEPQEFQQILAGKFDVPEIEITCARCRSPLVGPPDALLGQACPICQAKLPNG